MALREMMTVPEGEDGPRAQDLTFYIGFWSAFRLASAPSIVAPHTDRQCSREDAKGLFSSFVIQLQTLAREQLSKPRETAGSKQHDQAAWQERQVQRAAAAAVAPESYFKSGEFAGRYSRYDERGVPTHAADGEQLAKSALKKLEKLYSAHVKKFERAGSSGIGAEASKQ